MVHSVTKHTPDEAMKPGNKSMVKFNLELKKRSSRRYPDIEVGDTVRIFKKKDKLDKERISNWSSKKYKVKDIKESLNQNFYELEGYDKPLMRSELLLLD
jgi:hypothetical protein